MRTESPEEPHLTAGACRVRSKPKPAGDRRSSGGVRNRKRTVPASEPVAAADAGQPPDQSSSHSVARMLGAFQSSAIPVGEIGRSLVCGVDKGTDRIFG